MTRWTDIITDSTISRTDNFLDFTMRASKNMQLLIRKEDFSERDSETILNYLLGQAEYISFGQYLKRYMFQTMEVRGDFEEIPNAFYKKALKEAFEQTHTPTSFHETSSTLNVLINGWLNAAAVSRETVFLIGFALQMPVEDVSMFLTKAICGQDFDFREEQEVICWHCFTNGFPANHAKKMMASVQGGMSFSPGESGMETEVPKDSLLTGDLRRNKRFHLQRGCTDEDVLRYLFNLKSLQCKRRYSLTASDWFVRLLYRAKIEIEKLSREEDCYVFGETKQKKSVREADVEKVLYSGVPVDRRGNLKNISFSSLGKSFARHRLTRQRMSRLLSDKAAVTRFDLLTMLFLIYALKEDDFSPVRRYKKFVCSADAMLADCFMGSLNVSNLYEAFLLVCLLTEDPLGTFSDVWELSYGERSERE